MISDTLSVEFYSVILNSGGRNIDAAILFFFVP